ncbi:sushi domain-containing protein 2-like [Ptychodera flava]|uniref:sushi domain-containing protein 2-like n=1 Tax=Ptychodera flava TaxID=63121 RepID=UPI003969EDD4
MKGHGTDAVQIQVSERRILDVWIKSADLNDDWQGVDFDQTDRWTFNGLYVVKEIQGNTAVVTVSFSLGVSVQVTATEGTLMMSYAFFGPPSMKGTTQGLMGTWNDNPDDDLLTPEGITISPTTTMQELHYSFGMKWNVTEEESLFRYDIGQSHASLNDYNYVPTFEITPNDEAMALCGDDKLCLFDYQITGSENFARQTKQAVEKHRSIIEDTAAVVSCGFLEAPANGSTAVEKIIEGGTAFYYCNEGFTLVGSDMRTCLRNGSWTGQQPLCEVIDCGPPEEIDNANIYLTCTEYNCTVEYKCSSGYTSKGSKIRICQGDGEWSGERPSCTKNTWFVWLIVSVVLVTVVAIAFVLYCVQRYHAKKSKTNEKSKNSVSPVNTPETFVNPTYEDVKIENLD